MFAFSPPLRVRPPFFLPFRPPRASGKQAADEQRRRRRRVGVRCVPRARQPAALGRAHSRARAFCRRAQQAASQAERRPQTCGRPLLQAACSRLRQGRRVRVERQKRRDMHGPLRRGSLQSAPGGTGPRGVRAPRPPALASPAGAWPFQASESAPGSTTLRSRRAEWRRLRSSRACSGWLRAAARPSPPPHTAIAEHLLNDHPPVNENGRPRNTQNKQASPAPAAPPSPM